MYQRLTHFSSAPPAESNWQALIYFNLYRFLVAFLFVSLYWVGQLPEPLGIYNSAIFSVTAHIYLLIAIVFYLFAQIKHPAYVYQVISHVLADIIIIVLLMDASAGLNSGFGMLLVITVAGGSILTPGILGILYAAIATIAVLGHEVYVLLYQVFFLPNYTHAGFLGITFFVTAFVCNALSKRVQQSEALAKKTAIDLENLAVLNEYIVQRLQSGILVIDEDGRIILSNESAKLLLNVGYDIQNHLLQEHFPELSRLVNEWSEKTANRTANLQQKSGGIDIQASFSKLYHGQKFIILVYLDDVSRLRQRAQQLKLASLGRFTASIAHEIRNPLGAISHASQLLAESERLNVEDERLIAIIDEHSHRVNNIIESIMRISRREQSAPVSIDLNKWLEKFRDDFAMRIADSEEALHIKPADEPVQVRMDPSQLHQVVWNLCENALRYSRRKPLVTIHTGIRQDSKRPYMDIIDTGPGIDESIEDQLFEPFHTTSSSGTGLGLYIARELCEANQAALILASNTPSGCSFRINFSHPEKQHVLE